MDAVIDTDEIDCSFAQHLHGCGYRHARPIEDGIYAAIMPLMFTHAIIIGRISGYYGYEDAWCFHNYTPRRLRSMLGMARGSRRDGIGIREAGVVGLIATHRENTSTAECLSRKNLNPCKAFAT